LLLKTVSGPITVDQHKAKLKELLGETSEGVLSGRVEARFGARDEMEVAADMSVDGLPAQQVLGTTNDKKEHLHGNLSLIGRVEARIEKNSPLQRTLNTGRDGLVVKVTNDRLQQDPVLSKVIKILNLPAVLSGQVDVNGSGVPFDSISPRVVH